MLLMFKVSLWEEEEEDYVKKIRTPHTGRAR